MRSGSPTSTNTAAVELPYGRKRALEIATTLALDPEMMLLDEPTAGMAHEDVERIAALIRTVAADRTVLMVEHNLSRGRRPVGPHHRAGARRGPGRGRLRDACRSIPDVIEAYLGTSCLSRCAGAAPCSRSRGLQAWYGESHILHGVDFEVGAGEVVTLLGRNGAGKTTTLKSVMGIVARREGSVRVRGPGDRSACRRTASPGSGSPSARRSAASSPA